MFFSNTCNCLCIVATLYFWSFNSLKWQMSPSYTSTIKTTSLSCTWSLKKVPLSGETLCLGHYSTPSCTESSTWYSDIVWYELHQTFCAHEEVLCLFYDNFHFSSKEREGFGVLFWGGGVNWGSAVSENLAFNAIQWFWFRKKLSEVFRKKTNGHCATLKFTD